MTGYASLSFTGKADVSKRFRLISLVCPLAGRSSNDHTQAWLLERTTIASFQYRRYHEAYPWVGLASFVLFVSALALEQTLWRRLP